MEPAAKEPRVAQKLREDWSKSWPFIAKSPLGDSYARCSIMGVTKISSGGGNVISRHVLTPKHKGRAECKQNACNLKNFFQQVKSRGEDDLQVIRAETLFANAIVEHNLSLALADHMSDLFTKMFPDSQIAKKYAAGRTKTRGLVQVLADSAESSITSENQQKPFSPSTDGSNDKGLSLLQKFEKRNSNDRAVRAHTFLQSSSSKLYALFLSYTLPIFTEANTFLQKEDPVLHLMQNKLRDVITDLLVRFVKPLAISKAENLYLIQHSRRSKQKDREDLMIGERTRAFLEAGKAEGNLGNTAQTHFYEDARSFFSTALGYVISKLPVQDQLLAHAEVLNVKLRSKQKFASLRDFALDVRTARSPENRSFRITKLKSSWRLSGTEKEWSWPHCKATPSIQKKVECWNEIASAVNTTDPARPRRDGRECKKKWTDLKSAVVRYRSDLMRTGGGELPKIPEYFETVMGMIGDQKALLNGIEVII
ncbi:hypothetical protein RRG08_033830 [Elysia crispata]|uniref:Myb/SANT-like DNA-binding domain-containing protein n=1 Tax=Elysia crispata TaxID=231223 RepID=A0AAE1AR10_9GAST|nr:hypothetical protein RRG08_033830 [Elysia crispata]